MSNGEVMPGPGRRVKLTVMGPAALDIGGSKSTRILFRLVQVAILAYAAREAVRYISHRLDKP